MSDPREHFKWRLGQYMKDREEIVSEINRLKNGDSNGMIHMSKHPDGRITPEPIRTAEMLNNRIVKLCDLDSRIEEYCANAGLESPLKQN